MYLFHLGKQFRGVVLREEEMIDCGCDFDSEPLSELLVLDAQILDCLFLLDFLEEFGEAVAFDNISAEPTSLANVIK